MIDMSTISRRGAIASALTLVCSDANSDVSLVVDDVIACLEHAGFRIYAATSVTNGWQPIETAPRDGTKIDLWCKWWRADTDTFLGSRVPDCYWMQRESRWASDHPTTPANSRFTHWMQRPDDPIVTPAPP